MHYYLFAIFYYQIKRCGLHTDIDIRRGIQMVRGMVFGIALHKLST